MCCWDWLSPYQNENNFKMTLDTHFSSSAHFSSNIYFLGIFNLSSYFHLSSNTHLNEKKFSSKNFFHIFLLYFSSTFLFYISLQHFLRTNKKRYKKNCWKKIVTKLRNPLLSDSDLAMRNWTMVLKPIVGLASCGCC